MFGSHEYLRKEYTNINFNCIPYYNNKPLKGLKLTILHLI